MYKCKKCNVGREQIIPDSHQWSCGSCNHVNADPHERAGKRCRTEPLVASAGAAALPRSVDIVASIDGKYSTPNLKTDSGYASEGDFGDETLVAKQELSHGAYDLVRKTTHPEYLIFSPGKSSRAATYKSHYAQARKKFDFFQRVYPELRSQFYQFEPCHNTYRMVLPFFQGTDLFTALQGLNIIQQKEIYRLVLMELKRIHSLGIAIIDINQDNMIVDREKKKVYFIDGGNHCTRATGYVGPTPALDVTIKSYMIKNYPHMPPEYWDSTLVADIFKMDVYTFMYIHKYFFMTNKSTTNYQFPESLICNARSEHPLERPSIDALLAVLAC